MKPKKSASASRSMRSSNACFRFMTVILPSEDLKAFIAFYGSAEGQKLISTIPELMKESVQESIKYMEEKFPEVKQGQ